jgi:tRNA(adenine34) deaminase
MIVRDDTFFMGEALKLASQALEENEIPVGCVVVADGKIIGKGYNQTEKLNDSTAHAEMLAITSAFQFLGAKYLKGCKLYVTLEPCPMCAGAANWSQLQEVIYGADDPKKGFNSFFSENRGLLHPATKIKSGLLAGESKYLLEEFFKKVRSK